MNRGYLSLLAGVLSALFVIFSLQSVSVYAQQPPPSQRGTTDTSGFRAELENASTDEEKLLIYRQINSPRFNFPADTVLAMADEMQTLDVNPAERAAFYHYTKGQVFERAVTDSSIYHFRRAADLFHELDITELYLSALSLLSGEKLVSNQILEAEDLILSAIEYALEHDAPKIHLRSFYSQAASLYARTMAYDQAIYMNEKILEIQDDELSRCGTRLHIATLLFEMERYDESKELLDTCIRLDSLHPQMRAVFHIRMSDIHLAKNDTTAALTEASRANSYTLNSGNPNLEADFLAREGTFTLQVGDYDRAANIAERLSEPIFERIAPPAMVMKNVFLAMYYHHIGDSESSLNYSDEAILLANRFDLKQELGSVYDTRAAAFEAQGDVQQALVETRRQIELNESIAALKNEREEASARVRYELRMYEASLTSALQGQQSATTRFWYILIFSVGLFFGLIYIYRRYQNSQASVEDYSIKLTQAEAEHQKLQRFIEENNRKLKQQEEAAGTNSNGSPQSVNNGAGAPDAEFVEFSKQLKLASDSISYLEADGNYVKIYRPSANGNGKQSHIMERMSLKKAMELLPPQTFVRLHRSTVANINHIQQINTDSVVLRCGTELRMSRRYKKELADSLPVV
ncbi:MAG: LytTR family transcriptional regulator [Balneolia bacterium]|nr:LytTR family transcriptional regulator [Balneolia bacterium]